MQRSPRKQINKPKTNQSQINKAEITKPQIRKPEPRLKSNMNITEQFNKLFDEKQMSAIQSKENSPEINKGKTNKSEINKSEIKYTPTLLDKIFAITGALGICLTLMATIYFVIQNW